MNIHKEQYISISLLRPDEKKLKVGKINITKTINLFNLFLSLSTNDKINKVHINFGKKEIKFKFSKLKLK